MAGWKKSNIRRTPQANTVIVPVVRERIKIPQPVERPLDIHAKDLVIKPYVNLNPWWYTLHRKGIRREKLGDDPLEKRAVPRTMVTGTLPERIVYFALVNLLHLTEGVDFDFQSSQSGGRIELGGIVADFLFPIMKIVIQVQGPTHSGYLRSKKDQEQIDILAEMGYRTFEIEDTVIYDEARFENWLRNTFNLGGVGGGTGGNYNVTMQTGVNTTSSAFYYFNGGRELEAKYEIIWDNCISLITDCLTIIRRFHNG